MAEPTHTRFATNSEGDQVAYRTLGQGEVAVVLMGTASCVDLLWDDPVYSHLMHRLARLGQVITFDWRGLGASDRLRRGEFPTVEAWADDARVVLDAVGCRRGFIIADSIVSPFGLVFAATYPDRTAGIVIVDGWARLFRDDNYLVSLTPELVDPFFEELHRTMRTIEGATNSVPSRASDPEFGRFLARVTRLTAGPAFAVSVAKSAVRLDVRDVLSIISCPTLIVQRARNPFLEPFYGEYLASHIAGARLVMRPGVEDFWFSPPDADEVADLVEEFVTGAPPVIDDDRALATVLFTDIVGSTELAAKMGDQAWVSVLGRHDAIVDQELHRFRGTKINPTGDGMVATFDGPARAVRCAQAIAARVVELGLEVRAGLHTGEIVRRGADVGGIAVHVASRISSLAAPSEVLVSRTVTDLVLGSEIAFDDYGERDLKGVPGPWGLFAVRG